MKLLSQRQSGAPSPNLWSSRSSTKILLACMKKPHTSSSRAVAGKPRARRVILRHIYRMKMIQRLKLSRISKAVTAMVSGSLGYRKCPKTVTIRSTATKVMYRKKSEGKKTDCNLRTWQTVWQKCCQRGIKLNLLHPGCSKMKNQPQRCSKIAQQCSTHSHHVACLHPT